MKILIAILVFAFGAAAAERPKGVPAGAVAASPGIWRYTDAQGKHWIYRSTPFGVAHFEDVPEPMTLDAFPGARATEEGDFILFERPSPFGTYRWRTRKSELTAVEKAIWKSSAEERERQD